MRRPVDTFVKLCDKQKILSLILLITNSFLCFFKSIAAEQLKIHILIGAVHQTKKTLCNHQKNIWVNLKEWLNLEADKDTTKKEIGKNGETKMHLTVENENIDVFFSLDFIENNLSNSICHYTVLFNFRSVYLRVLETLLTVEISIGFSENLTLSLPKEIQSMYWDRLKLKWLYILGLSTLKATKYTTLMFQMIFHMISHLFLLH